MTRSGEWAAWDHAYLWHPFTPMQEWLGEEPLIIERGEGCELIDIEGARYLDGVSSLWVNVHGHGHPRLDEALRAQLDRIAHTTFLGLSHPPGIELAKKLVEITPGGLTRVFFSENGSAAVEVALKMAWSYWRNLGQERGRFVRLQRAYHGDTIGAVSVGGIERFHEAYRPLLFPTQEIPAPYCYRCSLGLSHPACELACARALEDLLGREGDEIAALIVEPLVQGAAGILTAPEGHLRVLAEIAAEHGILLIADEVATGFGKTGFLFACAAEGVEPDLLCLGKGLTGGYLPLSATLATEGIFEAFLASPAAHKTLYHGHSYAGNPLCCALALANLELFEREETLAKLPPKIALLGSLLEGLRDLPWVGDLRQRGLMCGVELVRDKESKEPFPEGLRFAAKICRALRQKGVILRPLGEVIVLMPPLAISEEEIERILGALREAISEVGEALRE